MRIIKSLIFLITFVFISTSLHAQESDGGRYLTTQQIERVRAFKELLGGVDKKTVLQTISEIERSRHPQIDLAMKEAMAKAYADIVRDFGIEAQKKKEWLYSMICLNMAYLQFGGAQGRSGSTTELNRLIRQKLKAYLPDNTLNQSGFRYSLE